MIEYKIGDTRKLIKEIKDESIDLIVTSPPYFNVKDYKMEDQIGFGQSYVNYIEDLNFVWNECRRILRPNGKICINIKPVPVIGQERSRILDIMRDVEVYMEFIGMQLSNMFIWDKRKYNNQVIFGSYPYPPNFYSHLSYEYINVFRKPGKTKTVKQEIKDRSKLTMQEWKKYCIDVFWDISPVIKFGKNGEIRGHDAPFPVEIPRRLIRLFSFVEDIVFDPFLGSGTTLSACILEQRNGIGFELNPEYEGLIKLAIRNPKKPPSYSRANYVNGFKNLSELLKK